MELHPKSHLLKVEEKSIFKEIKDLLKANNPELKIKQLI